MSAVEVSAAGEALGICWSRRAPGAPCWADAGVPCCTAGTPNPGATTPLGAPATAIRAAVRAKLTAKLFAATSKACCSCCTSPAAARLSAAPRPRPGRRSAGAPAAAACPARPAVRSPARSRACPRGAVARSRHRASGGARAGPRGRRARARPGPAPTYPSRRGRFLAGQPRGARARRRPSGGFSVRLRGALRAPASHPGPVGFLGRGRPARWFRRRAVHGRQPFARTSLRGQVVRLASGPSTVSRTDPRDGAHEGACSPSSEPMWSSHWDSRRNPASAGRQSPRRSALQ